MLGDEGPVQTRGCAFSLQTLSIKRNASDREAPVYTQASYKLVAGRQRTPPSCLHTYSDITKTVLFACRFPVSLLSLFMPRFPQPSTDKCKVCGRVDCSDNQSHDTVHVFRFDTTAASPKVVESSEKISPDQKQTVCSVCSSDPQWQETAPSQCESCRRSPSPHLTFLIDPSGHKHRTSERSFHLPRRNSNQIRLSQIHFQPY